MPLTKRLTKGSPLTFEELDGNFDYLNDVKVEAVPGKELSDENYSTEEKGKLASLSNYYIGEYTSLSALNSSHPSGASGQYANVDSGSGSESKQYIWDTTDNAWVPSGSTGAVQSVNGQTGAVVLNTDSVGEGSSNKYFTGARVLSTILTAISFVDTSLVTAADNILQGIGKLQAQISALFKIPAGGTTGQILAKVDNTSGNTQWVTPNSSSIYFNVKSYGAIGNGINNDTVAIQNAINSAAVSGGTVYFPPGTYLSGALTSYGNVVIKGDDRINCIIKANSAVKLISIVATDDAFYVNGTFISDITLDGNSVGTVGLSLRQISASNFRNFTIHNFTQYGIEGIGLVEISFSGIYVHHCATGIYFNSTAIEKSNLLAMYDCTIQYCSSWGVEWIDGAMFTLQGCDFEFCGTLNNLSTGSIYAHNLASYSEGVGMNIIGCWFERIYGTAVKIANASGYNLSTISGSLFYYINPSFGNAVAIDIQGSNNKLLLQGVNINSGFTTSIKIDASTVGYIYSQFVNTQLLNSGTINNLVSTGGGGSVSLDAANTWTAINTFVSGIISDGIKVGKGGGSQSLNTIVGNGALNLNSTGNGNAGLGYEVMKNNTSGSYLNAFGTQALLNNTTGSYNTAMGNCLSGNTIGSENTAVGNNAMEKNTSGSQHVAIGSQALNNNLTHTGCVAIGYKALQNSKADYNIGIGFQALDKNTSGYYNCGIGWLALSSNLTGNQNTAMGFQAGNLGGNTSGSDNVFIGANTAPGGANQNNQIVVGSNATGRGSNTTTIGNSNTLSTKLFGKLNVGITNEYADNATAVASGLITGDIYRTGDILKIVHS